MEPKKSKKEGRKFSTSLVVGGLGIFSLIYLFNPGAGFIEFIPDNIPVVGNLDEAGATALLISCFAYFGLDMTKIIPAIFATMSGSKKRKEEAESSTIDVETI